MNKCQQLAAFTHNTNVFSFCRILLVYSFLLGIVSVERSAVDIAFRKERHFYAPTGNGFSSATIAGLTIRDSLRLGQETLISITARSTHAPGAISVRQCGTC